MFRKTIKPILNDKGVAGTTIEYRLFGILLYRKTMHNPLYYGVAEWDFTHKI